MYTIKHKKSHFARENSFNASKLLLHAQAIHCTDLSLHALRPASTMSWVRSSCHHITVMPFANFKLCAVLQSFAVRFSFGTSIEVFCTNQLARMWMWWNNIHYSMHATTRSHCAFTRQHELYPYKFDSLHEAIKWEKYQRCAMRGSPIPEHQRNVSACVCVCAIVVHDLQKYYLRVEWAHSDHLSHRTRVTHDPRSSQIISHIFFSVRNVFYFFFLCSY